uniref:Uncharacterized protein n=1 Tax=Rhizophora mucronata TaxID=61149 RepID=A0A2P2QUJ5_RHIMU
MHLGLSLNPSYPCKDYLGDFCFHPHIELEAIESRVHQQVKGFLVYFASQGYIFKLL